MSNLSTRLRPIVGAYPELISVLGAATVGLTVQSPLAWLASHQGIDVLLAVLVFATALTIEPAALRRVGGSSCPLMVAVATGIIVLPALSWLASRLVPVGSLRDGVMVAGLAPCEIASVATTAMARGEAALSAGVLVGSTVAIVVLAGPVLTFEAGHASVHPGGIVINLALVVALPLAVGILVRGSSSLAERAERPANVVAVASVAALVALIAAEVHFSVSYFGVAAALAVFLVASAGLGRLLGFKAERRVRSALLLTTSMRDFAIAADLAVAAFGPAAAAPLGLYGILVLVWGSAVAGVLRQRNPECAPIKFGYSSLR